jgi:acetoacetyl-CoA synthetase
MSQAIDALASGSSVSISGGQRGRELFTPTAQQIDASRLSDFARFLERTRGLRFGDYSALQRWSITELRSFWQAIAEYFDVRFRAPASAVLEPDRMPGAHWFSGAKLNYAEHALRADPQRVALLVANEQGEVLPVSYAELALRVARCQHGLRRLGVGKGDRVVGYLPNSIEAVIALLACAGLGAIWSSCPPEFGVVSVLDRFVQIRPKVLIGVDAYTHGGKAYARRDELEQIHAGLPADTKLVIVRPATALPPAASSFDELLASQGQGAQEVSFEAVDFEHPLWILYSSGTTGKPKAIVQGHGGILLEHLKVSALHHDIGPNDCFFWYSTTGWMMWNYLVSGLLLGAKIVLYDGSPTHPDLGALWRLAERTQITHFGASAPYFMACRERRVQPRVVAPGLRIRALGSTGAPLPPEGFEWAFNELGPTVPLASVSGGTDVCSAIVLGCPWLPVRAGELQCSALGADVCAFTPDGNPVVGSMGELVIRSPMPSMPLFFWGDEDGSRYRASYFENYPGVWRHGDWMLQFADGAAVILGRSDATLNRGGVRMGTSEFYRVVEELPEVADSLVVDLAREAGRSELWLFVVPRAGSFDGVEQRIRAALKSALSPRHVPDVICEITGVPYTLSGKKLELPVKRILEGAPVESTVNLGTLRNPEALLDLVRRARARHTT